MNFKHRLPQLNKHTAEVDSLNVDYLDLYLMNF